MRRAVFALALLLPAAPALAQPAELTKEFQAGVDAYRLGKYDEARGHLEKARDIDPKLPGPYRFLSVVAQAQGRWADCIENARQALSLNPRSSEAPETRKVYEQCRISGGRSPYAAELGDSAAIAVTTNVPGATVKVNGLSYGATPMAPRPITAGKLDLEIEKQGWKSVHVEVDALGGIVTDVSQDLEPDPNARGNDLQVDPRAVAKIGWLIVPTTTASIEIDGKPVTASERIEVAPGTHVVELRQPTKDPWRRRVRVSAGQKTQIAPAFVDTETRSAQERRGLYIVGAGGALLLGGFVTAMISRDASAEARDIVRIETARDPSQPLSVTGQIAPVRTRADLIAAHDRANTFGLVSDISYGAGLVAVGVGAYYLYKGARERTDVPPPFAIAPTHGGLFVAKELAW